VRRMKGFRCDPTNGRPTRRDGTEARHRKTRANRSGPAIPGRFGTEGSVVQIHSPRPNLIWGLRPQTPHSLTRATRLQSKTLRQVSARVARLADRELAQSLLNFGPAIQFPSFPFVRVVSDFLWAGKPSRPRRVPRYAAGDAARQK